MDAMFTAGANPRTAQVVNNVPDSWATKLSGDMLRTWRDGKATTCQHLMNPKVSDNVGVLVAWEPDKIACPLCAISLMPGEDAPGDHTCDQCGRDTKNDDRGLKQCRLATGQLMFIYFLCSNCDTGGPMGPLERHGERKKQRPDFLRPAKN